jgi:hypothetical protein
MNTPEDRAVQKVASVAPATVTKVSRLVLEPTRRKYNRRESAPAPELHTHIKVVPMLWEAAQAACRPGEHLVIVDETTVITEYDR